MYLGVNSGNTFIVFVSFSFILFLIHGELIRELLHSMQPVAVLQEKLESVFCIS